MIQWLHRLFNPHCPHCREEKEDNRICQSCETLKMQLAIVNAEKERLLSAILEKPKVEEKIEQVDYDKLKPRMTTWNIRRQMLEAEDRRTAALLADQKKKVVEGISKLEEEVGIKSEVNTDAEAI